LDSFVRIGTFQWVTAIPNRIFLRPWLPPEPEPPSLGQRRPHGVLLAPHVGEDVVNLAEVHLAGHFAVFQTGVCRLVAAGDPVEGLEIGRDGLDLAAGDGFAGKPRRRRKTRQLHFHVVGAVVDRPLPQDLGDDLSHALGGQPLGQRDLVIGPALAKLGEDASPPDDPIVGVEPPLRRGRRLLIHANLAVRAAFARRGWERAYNSSDIENRKENVRRSAHSRRSGAKSRRRAMEPAN
jgi:hypothetical protein